MSIHTARRARLGWLVAPATDSSTRATAIVLAALRFLAGLLWIYNISWKQPPGFGQSSRNGLYGFTKDAVDHPVFAPFSWVVDHLVLPNFTAFGYAVLVVETVLAILLLTGTVVRLAALIGIAQSLAIALSVSQTPGEWPWSYWMMIGIHVVFLFTAAGSVLAVDAVRSAREPRRAATILAYVWGGVVSAAALVALGMSVGDNPLAANGARLGGSGISISLGRYNLIGSLVLLLVGILLLAAAGLKRPALTKPAIVVAVVAAVLIYLHYGLIDNWLGGTTTSAAFFICAALVCAAATEPLRVRTNHE